MNEWNISDYYDLLDLPHSTTSVYLSLAVTCSITLDPKPHHPTQWGYNCHYSSPSVLGIHPLNNSSLWPNLRLLDTSLHMQLTNRIAAWGHTYQNYCLVLQARAQVHVNSPMTGTWLRIPVKNYFSRCVKLPLQSLEDGNRNLSERNSEEVDSAMSCEATGDKMNNQRVSL